MPNLTLPQKVIAGLVLVALTTVTTAGLLVDRTVQRAAEQNARQQLDATARTFGQMTASALFGDLDPDDTSLNPPVRALARAVDTHLSLLTPSGSPVADSSFEDPRAAGSQSSRPELAAARARGVGFASRDGSLWVARAIERDGHRLGYARASIPLSRVEQVVVALRWRVLTSALVAMLVALALAALISRSIVRPVRRLAEDARKIGAGDLKHRARVETDDALGALAGELNEMTARIEVMVARLDQRNHDMRVVLDNVGQGLLTADREGVVLGERSAIVDRWFRPIEPGTRLWEIFRDATARDTGNLRMSWEQVFENTLPLELTLAQLPGRMRCGETTYDVTYEPIMEGGEVAKMLLVLSDVTSAVHAERLEAEQRDLIALFGAIGHDRVGVEGFVQEADSLVRDLVSGESSRTEVLRTVHTLKGVCSLYGARALASRCHAIEDRLFEDEHVGRLSEHERAGLDAAWRALRDKLPTQPPGGDSGPLDVRDEDIDTLQKLIAKGEERALLAHVVGTWKLDPVDRRLERLSEQACQLAERLGKARPEVLVMGNGVRLDAQRWAPFWSALSHVVRNAVDHGIEGDAERAARGKPARGRLEFRTWADNHGVRVEVTDDGCGIHWELLRERARAKGLAHETHDDLVSALLTDGVSTRDVSTLTSGRGVGMAAVMAVTRALGGALVIESAEGHGTTFRFKFPLNAAVRESYPMRGEQPAARDRISA